MSPADGPPTRARRVPAAGVWLHCLEWGDGQGPRNPSLVPFLLVHGLASNCRTWERVGDLLAARGHPVAAVDQRGHGRSEVPDTGYDFATLCDDLEAVLDALGYERAVVVGQSTGGNIAVDLARRAGHRLAGVAGVDGGTIALQKRWPRWDDCAAALAPPLLSGTPVAEMRLVLGRAHPDWDDWGIEATLANLAVGDDGTVAPRLSLEHHMLILRALWEHCPATVFPELTVPVLLLVADSDDAWSSDKRAGADRAVELLPRGRVHWLSPADHDVHVQQPEKVASLLLEAVADGFFLGR